MLPCHKIVPLKNFHKNSDPEILNSYCKIGFREKKSRNRLPNLSVHNRPMKRNDFHFHIDYVSSILISVLIIR